MIKRFIIAIDLGGTNLKCALLDSSLKIKAKSSFSTKSFDNKYKLIQGIIDSVESFILNQRLKRSAILGVGIGVPGPVDTLKGIVHFLPNIPGWKEVKLKKILEQKTKLPVFIDNDAKLMTLAEHEAGAAKNYKNALCLTLGTGVGGGLIINDLLYRGPDNAAGEIGHLPLNEKGPWCGCGARGCLEAYVGNHKIIKDARKLFGSKITLERVSALARENNPKAINFWNQVGEKLGLALSGMVNLLNLDLIVIGGGVSCVGGVLLENIRRTILLRAMRVQAKRVRVVKAKLGIDAGIIGAGYLVRERISVILSLIFGFVFWVNLVFAEATKESPMVINGDNVEYSADSQEVVATGNIEVIYKGAKLTCNRLKVNMQTKEGLAEGNARIQDAKGVVTGEKIIYDFANKTGIIYDANFRANPYFGKAKKVEKVSESEFVNKGGYFTTCSLDQPHYRFAVKKLNMFPGDKMQAKQATLYLGAVPLFYLPQFNYSMKEPMMHVQVEPGTRKDWGLYLLSAWRYNITDNVNGRALLDYRNKLGWAEGFNLNYKTPAVGKGDFKFYYTLETPPDQPDTAPVSDYYRYFMRWRHKWNIDERTNVTAEFLKITDQRRKDDTTYTIDHSFLQDYFFREYEKDTEPLSYAFFHHAFNYSSLDVLLQIRTNHWFDQIEKKPEINYNLPSLQLGESPFYFESINQLGTYNKNDTTSLTPTEDIAVTRLDTKNTFSLPTKIAFIQFKPFVSSRQTFYDKGANGQSGIARTIFYSGADMSTKFYRVFDTKTNFLGLDVNGLRHIITPTIGYLYTHPPTVSNSNIKYIDGVDSINRGNTAALSLSNKLQTKRNGQSVDFVDFLITTNYVLDPKKGDNAFFTSTREGEGLKSSNFSDIIFNLKVLPYSWVRWESDATFAHSDHSIGNKNFNKFSLANYDLSFDLAKDRSFSIGQRYERKGKNEVTLGFSWLLNPKWKFHMYQRFNFKKTDMLDRGSQEQEYTVTRDLHCWDLDVSLNRKADTGTTIFFLFRLKAFPENEFGFDQAMTKKKSGTQ
ncbi:MAG: ROK family protein [Candidatus Omnitrophica bacterium]|nr:ROK family protein [Candidatus Omnitrophota bacterium]